ncbi:hypothetical protein [Pseudonocardia sp. DLS-67]
MIDEAVGLSSFCHISEYATDQPGEFTIDGYDSLHRMASVSAPLNLWSPSSAFIRRPSCRLSSSEFLDLLRRGYIRVYGRKGWIGNSEKRQELARRWSGATWDDEIDGGILQQHLIEDIEQVPISRRGVIIAPEERGYDKAEEMLAENPDLVGQLYGAFENPADRRIPIGTRETVVRDLRDYRHGDVPAEFAVAKTILRDAQNHADAMTLCDATAPFLLSADDTEFLNFLGQLRAPVVYPGYAAAPDALQRGAELQARLGELTRQVISLLGELDQIRSEHGELAEDRSITAWVGSEGHSLVMNWLSGLCLTIGTAEDEDSSGAVIDSLVDAVSRGGRWNIRSLRRLAQLEASTVDAVEVLSIVTLGNVGPFGMSDVGVEDLPRGGGLPEKLGWIRREYSGPQWPYLYIFGDRASRTRRRALLAKLSEIQYAG